MAAKQSKTTTDHETIRQWAEERGGEPAVIRETESGGSGVLRIHFPGVGADEETFDDVSWDEFFELFEENDLAFLYQEETKDGEESRFFKFVRRE